MCHDDTPVFPVRGGAPITESDITIETNNASPLPLFVAVPDATPAPGVLLIPDIHGPGEFYRDMARRLAGTGFTTALPDLFSRLPKLENPTRDENRARNGQLDQAESLEDVRAALAWLQTREDATGKLGTIGFCMGGTLVMLAAARQPLPDASVAFYGFPVQQRSERKPILPIDESEVSNLRSPLLALWGDQDRGVGMDNVEAYREAVTRHDKAHDFIIYPDAGHGFMTFDPSAETYTAAHDAWNRTLEFLGIHLGRPHYRD